MKIIHISPQFQRQPNPPCSPIPHKPSQNQSICFNNSRPTFLSPSQHKSPPIHPTNHLLSANIKQKKIISGRSIVGKQNLSPLTQQINQRKPSDKKITNKKSPFSQINSKTVRDLPSTSPSSFQITPFPHCGGFLDGYCGKMVESRVVEEDEKSQIKCQHFEKLKYLGKGKYGEVHLVMHKATGFICAMKIINKGVIRQENLQSQIAKELKIHSRMKHLNIINFYGFFHDEISFYILLEFGCEGSLFSKLKVFNRLEQQEIRPIIKHIGNGIRCIHRMGYVHRDIKPENVVMQFGIPKICDFGWATSCYESQLCSSYCGTPLYFSPEMVKKEKYNHSVDIWSLGLITYELLVGRGPFRIWTENDLHKIIDDEITYPSYIDRTKECEKFIEKCLQKKIHERVGSDKLLNEEFIGKVEEKDLNFEFYDSYAKIFNIY